MAIHFAPTESLPAQQNHQKPRQGSSSARPIRMAVCSRSKPGNRPRRGGCQAQAGLNQLIVSMVPLVKRVALQIRGRLPAHVELDDLVGAGALGLIDAVRKFDSSKGVTLKSYARLRIRGAILDSLRHEDPASRDVRRRIKKIETLSRNLASQLGRPAGGGEIAGALGLSLEEWYGMISELQQLGIEGTGMGFLREVRQRVDSETLPDYNGDNPFSLCYRREQRDILNQTLSCLTQRERSILEFYYQGSLTMREIGARLGIDESRVSQLRAGAISKLRVQVTAMPLQA